MIEKLQFKQKGSLLAQKVLTGSILSNALSVTTTPGYKSFRNISYTFASSRIVQVTVLHCSIARNINRVLHVSVHPKVDGQEVLYYYISRSVHCCAGNYVLIEDNFQGIVK